MLFAFQPRSRRYAGSVDRNADGRPAVAFTSRADDRRGLTGGVRRRRSATARRRTAAAVTRDEARPRGSPSRAQFLEVSAEDVARRPVSGISRLYGPGSHGCPWRTASTRPVHIWGRFRRSASTGCLPERGRINQTDRDSRFTADQTLRPSARETIAKFAALVDGLHALSAGPTSHIVARSSGSNYLAAKVYAAALPNERARSASSDYLPANGMSWRVSTSRMPATAAWRRRGSSASGPGASIRTAAVAVPIWDRASDDDPSTRTRGAAKGRGVITT